MRIILVGFIVWLFLVALSFYTRADDIAHQINSLYIERTDYISWVEAGLVEYNPEVDKSLGIDIDNLCTAWGRTPKQCWIYMLFKTGQEYRVYRGF